MPSELFARLQRDLNAARKAQDKPRTLLLGTVLADVKNRELEARRELNDAEVQDVIRKGIKRRRESVAMYEQARREDLAARERGEAELLEGYLPAGASDDEVRAAVRAAISSGAASVGAVMGQVVPRFKGRADGARINAIVREEMASKT